MSNIGSGIYVFRLFVKMKFLCPKSLVCHIIRLDDL